MPVNNFSVKVEGLKDLEQQLLSLEPKVARKALVTSMKAGGQAIKASARVNLEAHTDTGLLDSALKVKVKAGVASGQLFSGSIDGLGSISIGTGTESDKGSVVVKIGEYKPGRVAGRHKNYPRDPYYARFLESKFPYLRPALDQNVTRVVGVIREALSTALDKVNRRA